MLRLVLSAVLLLAAVPCGAQPVEEPLPRVVADLHGAWAGLPTSIGWVPEVSTDTPLPGRGFGISAGGHLHLFRWGLVTFGAGASVLVAEDKANALEPVQTTTTTASTAAPTALPIVTTRVTSLSPQLSFNFGHRSGWSYLSVGYGVTKIASTAAAVSTTPGATAPDAWNPALNFGGGARWFMKPHLGAGFDVRFTKLSSRGTTPTTPGAKRTQLVSILVGISIQ